MLTVFLLFGKVIQSQKIFVRSSALSDNFKDMVKHYNKKFL